MENKLNEKDSLRIISEMINTARGNLQKGSGDSTVFMGCCIAVIGVLNFILIHTLDNINQTFWVWLLAIPVQIIDFFIISKRTERKALVKTHIDDIIKYVWIGFVISVIVFLCVIFGTAYILNSYSMMMLIMPVILILTGLAQFITAKACRFKPYLYGAFVFWIGALSCFLVGLMLFSRGDLQFIILAISMIFGFVVPGYILNRKAEKYV